MIDNNYIVRLKGGRQYVLYAGVLAAAHAAGLAGIDVELLQAPSKENEYTAIARARVTMKSGAVYTDYGDASPKNTGPAVASALIRMAITRAKGRALRDAVNIGETLAEELPDLPTQARAAVECPQRGDTALLRASDVTRVTAPVRATAARQEDGLEAQAGARRQQSTAAEGSHKPLPWEPYGA